MEFNKQISNVEPSKSVTLLTKTKELQKSDPEILNLTGGEPDFPTPKAICDTVVADLLPDIHTTPTVAEMHSCVPALLVNYRKKIMLLFSRRIF